MMALPNSVTGKNGGICSGKFTAITTPDSDPVNAYSNSPYGGTIPNNAMLRHAAMCPPRF